MSASENIRPNSLHQKPEQRRRSDIPNVEIFWRCACRLAIAHAISLGTSLAVVFRPVFIVRMGWRSRLLSAAGCRPLTTALSRDRNASVQRCGHPCADRKDFPIFVSCMPSRYTYVVVGHVELHINDIKSDFSIKIIFMPLMAKYKG